MNEALNEYKVKKPDFSVGIVGLVVEFSPATRGARVRFPDDASVFCQVRVNFDIYSISVRFFTVTLVFLH